MRLLLVEDEVHLGTTIKRVLNREAYIVDWAQNGTEAWNYLDSKEPKYDLCILDWRLPELSGLELLKRLRSQNNSLSVLMLTAKDAMEDKVAGLNAGADDYLVKPFGMVELLARIRAIGRRSPQLQSQPLQVGGVILDFPTHTIRSNQAQQEIYLTAKEFQLLEYFMQHPEHVVTTYQLLNQLWELSVEPTSNVVAAQVRLLRRKLEKIGCDHLIETVHGIGYRFHCHS